jgi:peptidoglycan/xylan/chitin deacetylase (PgdA/CDA1 family)
MTTQPPLPRERVPYSAIVDRPPLKLPDGARMVIWTIVNVEDWGIERPMPRTVLPPPMGQPLLPDLPNWAWHEYGMRVGFWRLYDCMRKYGITPTLAINGVVCKTYPRVAQAAKDAGWEFMGHGYVQGPMHKLEDQRAAIRDTIAAIRAFTGKAPRGWESPGLTETYETIDFLAEEGIEYVADWVLDEQPVYIRTRKGPVVSVPYTVETNDIPMMLIQSHGSEELLKRGIDHFERLYAESANITRVMAISVHPYISGVPHRIGYLERLYEHIRSRSGVALWTGERILDWYRTQVPPPQ